MNTKIPQKEVSFGGGNIASVSPKSVQEQRCITAHLDFDAILRLKAAVDEATATLNRHDRATREGKRAGVWLAFYPEPHMMRFTLGRTTLMSRRGRSRPRKPGSRHRISTTNGIDSFAISA
jgi:hypothetical protein